MYVSEYLTINGSAYTSITSPVSALNQLSEDKLDKVSKFRIDAPARSRFKAETGEVIDVYAEPLLNIN